MTISTNQVGRYYYLDVDEENVSPGDVLLSDADLPRIGRVVREALRLHSGTGTQIQPLLSVANEAIPPNESIIFEELTAGVWTNTEAYATYFGPSPPGAAADGIRLFLLPDVDAGADNRIVGYVIVEDLTGVR